MAEKKQKINRDDVIVVLTQSLFEPAAFLVGTLVSCVVVFSSMGAPLTSLMSFMTISNNSNYVSEAVGILIPTSLVIAFSMGLGVFSILISVILNGGGKLPNKSIVTSMISYMILGGLLIFSLFVNILTFKDNFNQVNPLPDGKILEIQIFFYMNLIVAFLLVFVKSFSEVFYSHLVWKIVDREVSDV